MNNTNFTLAERAAGNGPAISTDELLDVLTELDTWRLEAERLNIDTPEELKPAFDELENRPLCVDEDHADYNVLETFFRDCQDLIGTTDAWSTPEENAKRMIEELHEMNRNLGVV